MANHKLAKAIADMGFYEFRRQLEYKSQLYGSKLLIVELNPLLQKQLLCDSAW